MSDQSDSSMVEQPVAIGAKRAFKLPRDCVVTIVPAGHQITLPQGQRVTLLQALGATATVTTADGEMARLSPEDSVDFGLIRASSAAAAPEDSVFNIEDVWKAAATIYDPEIPVDIVELGLVYRVDAHELPSGGWRIDIDMSVTAPFCGMGDILRRDLHDAVALLRGVEEVQVNLVFDPPWDASRLSDVARLEMGMM